MSKETIWARLRPKNTVSQEDNQTQTQKIVMIPLNMILPNPSQPRKRFDQVDIVALADSIRQHGLLQPISIRRSVKDDENEAKYYCIAGERRLRAYRMLGKHEIPCLILDHSPSESAELAIVENIMRTDLNLFEYAAALATLIEKYQMTQEDLARKMSTSQSNIANKLRLLRFSPKEQQLILENNLTERHARSLLRLQEESLRIEVIQVIAEDGLNVKETEKFIDSLLIPKKEKKQQNKSASPVDFCRIIDKSVARICKKGVVAQSQREENENEIRVIITIAKQTLVQ